MLRVRSVVLHIILFQLVITSTQSKHWIIQTHILLSQSRVKWPLSKNRRVKQNQWKTSRIICVSACVLLKVVSVILETSMLRSSDLSSWSASCLPRKQDVNKTRLCRSACALRSHTITNGTTNYSEPQYTGFNQSPTRGGRGSRFKHQQKWHHPTWLIHPLSDNNKPRWSKGKYYQQALY